MAVSGTEHERPRQRVKENFSKGGGKMENRKISLVMSEKARAARRRYMAEWRSKNRDLARASNIRYWEKQAEKEEAENNG